jgi:hypothetical protein
MQERVDVRNSDMSDPASDTVELPGCWTRADLQQAAALAGPWGLRARWPPEAVQLFLLNWAMDNRQHTFERYLPEAWPTLRAVITDWSLPMAQSPVTAAALCQVRRRLGMKPLQELYRRANVRTLANFDGMARRWGKRLWTVDGSWLNLPSEPTLAAEFGRPSGSENGRPPLPQALLVSLQLANLGWIWDYRLGAYRDAELQAGIELTAGLGSEDLLLADRLFFNTVWMKDLRERCVELLWRVTAVRWKSFCDASRARIEDQRSRGGVVDCDVQLKVDTDHKGRPRGGLLPLRYVELPPSHRDQETMRLLTSLSIERLPSDEIADGYHQRWGVETDLRLFKGPDHLPVVLSRRPDSVRQEILLRVLAHNLVRSVQGQACLLARATGSGSFPPSGHSPAAGTASRPTIHSRAASCRYPRRTHSTAHPCVTPGRRTASRTTRGFLSSAR